MSRQDESSVFQQFGSRRAASLRHAESSAPEQTHEDEADAVEMEAFHPWIEGEQRPYQAAIINRAREQMQAIRFYCENGDTIFQPLNSFLYDVTSTSPKRLSLIYTQHILTLKGRNLWKLLGNLQKGNIIALVAFHEAYHLEPDNHHAPFIREILRHEPGAPVAE